MGKAKEKLRQKVMEITKYYEGQFVKSLFSKTVKNTIKAGNEAFQVLEIDQ